MKIEVAERRHERVGIVNRESCRRHSEYRTDKENRDAALDHSLEQSRLVAQTHRPGRIARHDQVDRVASGRNARTTGIALEMRTENRMRIVMLQRQQTFQGSLSGGRARRDAFSLHSKSEV